MKKKEQIQDVSKKDCKKDTKNVLFRILIPNE
jgi:hypothetical protein